MQIYLTFLRFYFNEEDLRCHFESTVKERSFGVIRYSCKLYFEVAMHDRVLFDEAAFKECLMTSESMKERLLFTPLNLVFHLMVDDVGYKGTFDEAGR